MAMTTCTECAKEISDTAKACPHCGHRKPSAAPRAILGLLGIVVLGFIVLAMIGSTIPEYEIRAKNVRKVCLEIAMPYQRSECEAMYNESMREGREAARREKQGRSP